MGRDLFEIASLFIGVSVLALLIGHPSATKTVVTSVGDTFANLLKTVQLSNGGYGSFTTP